MSAIDQAIELVGGPVKLSAACGVTYQAVQKWRKLGKIPGEQVIPVCRATNGRVTPHDLRPDLYPDPDWMPLLNSLDQKKKRNPATAACREAGGEVTLGSCVSGGEIEDQAA